MLKLTHVLKTKKYTVYLQDNNDSIIAFSALTLLVVWQEGQPACKKTEWWGAGLVICLERGADLHMAQLMPLPVTVSCFSKSRLVLPSWYQLTWVVPDKGPLNGCVVCVCVCVLILSTAWRRCWRLRLRGPGQGGRRPGTEQRRAGPYCHRPWPRSPTGRPPSLCDRLTPTQQTQSLPGFLLSWLQQKAQLSPMDRAIRRISWNLANCHATVQKLFVRQVLNKSKLWS